MARLSLILIFIASEKCVSMLSVPQQKGATAAAGGCGVGVVLPVTAIASIAPAGKIS